ncbi:hypothetical protein PAF17_00290 [Paracoccus sp. Z330]|uniref:Uncharacterized protein n=1 Tax=Paracoccus onchidii TaxID=3017813 RepID=A0ABT4Z9B8_9RHOB|nr:protealysin inhibitor emfourin [Paracoccus onchidii]MDB6175944.1 hypothetical protein [Paracoccus onchidii]
MDAIAGGCIAMIIEIAAQGGIGGFAAPNLNKRIDVDQQSTQLRRELCKVFGPEQLARLARTPCNACADRLIYRITIIQGSAAPRNFTLREDQLPAQMLDLLDQF